MNMSQAHILTHVIGFECAKVSIEVNLSFKYFGREAFWHIFNIDRRFQSKFIKENKQLIRDPLSSLSRKSYVRQILFFGV